MPFFWPDNTTECPVESIPTKFLAFNHRTVAEAIVEYPFLRNDNDRGHIQLTPSVLLSIIFWLRKTQ
jgi:hypothetical protein